MPLMGTVLWAFGSLQTQVVQGLGFILVRDPQQTFKTLKNGGCYRMAYSKFRTESVSAFEEAKMDI